MATVKGEPVMCGFVLSFLCLSPSLSDRRGGVVEGVGLWGLAWWRVFVCGDQCLWWTSMFVVEVEVWVTVVAGLWNR